MAAIMRGDESVQTTVFDGKQGEEKGNFYHEPGVGYLILGTSYWQGGIPRWKRGYISKQTWKDQSNKSLRPWDARTLFLIEQVFQKTEWEGLVGQTRCWQWRSHLE